MVHVMSHNGSIISMAMCAYREMPRRHNGGSKLLGMLLLLLVDPFGTQVKPLQHQVGKFLLVCERKSTEDIYSLGFKSRLQTPFNQEKPRNHLDLRNWLNSKDQREGKVIDYRVSELRVVELLDGLCEKMQEYTLDKLASTRHEWVKVDDWDSLTTDKREARAY